MISNSFKLDLNNPEADLFGFFYETVRPTSGSLFNTRGEPYKGIPRERGAVIEWPTTEL